MTLIPISQPYSTAFAKTHTDVTYRSLVRGRLGADPVLMVLTVAVAGEYVLVNRSNRWRSSSGHASRYLRSHSVERQV
jgi:hypothetical protein